MTRRSRSRSNDFCAEQGIPYHSLDGLDIAWYGGPIHPKGTTDVTKAAPSLDLPELLRYAKEKGVRLRLWMHWKALKPQIDEAFATYEKWGIEGVMVDFMDRDDQEMVRFYHEMADSPAAYRGQPGLEFLVQVPTNWDETRVLHAEVGKCLVIARRKGDAWYLGGMTSAEDRELALPLSFLGEGRFEAEFYLDHPADGPNAVTRRKQAVSAADPLRVVMPRAGGFAGRLTRTAR